MKKVCKKCKYIVTKGEECPVCHNRDFGDNPKGRIIIIDVNKSEIAKKLEIKQKGEYAIKI